MIKTLLPCLLLLCAACAGPAFSTRAVQGDQAWLVRLDTYADQGKAGGLLFDHPVDWPEKDFKAILGAVLILERSGLLDQKQAPQSVFSDREISQLAPGLRKAFLMARPSEWVSFTIAQSAGPAPTITSGGFFVKDKQLHVLLANHREPTPSGSDGAEAVRANPLQALKRSGRVLTFNPPMFAVAVQESWMGGYAGAPASELVLDQTAFLASLRPPAAAPATAPLARDAAPSAGIAPVPPAQSDETILMDLKGQVTKLQEENERLQQKLNDQAEEIAKLKARRKESESPQTKKPAKKSTQ